MTIEAAPYVSSLNANYPAIGDPKSEGDDHLRLLKSSIVASFPNISGPVTLTHAEINASITASIAAAAAAGATVWTAKAYTAGQCVYSPTNFQTYRAKAAFTSAVDPAIDESAIAPAWARLTGSSTPDFLLQAQGII